mmetsp:Transcript_159081/g.280855  ORF Transcript_159081/g.280855 Transcript_159081/m.280855 type:complete len:224 (+) Transcript_159081:96-767(+)
MCICSASPRCSCDPLCMCTASKQDPLCACTGVNLFNQTLADTYGADFGKTCSAIMHGCKTDPVGRCLSLSCQRGCYVNSTCSNARPSHLIKDLYWSYDNCEDDADEVATCPWTEQACTEHKDCTYNGCCSGGDDLVACSPKVNKCAKGKVDDRCNGRPNGYRVDSWIGVCYEGRIDLECPRMLANESTNACEIKFPYDLSGAQRLCMTSSTALLATAFVSTMV